VLWVKHPAVPRDEKLIKIDPSSLKTTNVYQEECIGDHAHLCWTVAASFFLL